MNKEISNEKIIQILTKILYIILFIILLLIGTVSLFFTAKMSNVYFLDTENIEFLRDNVFLNILIIGVLGICIFSYIKIAKNIPEKIVLGLTLGILFVISSIWVIYMNEKVPIRADQEIVLNIAKEFLNGNYTELLKQNYLGMFPYQIGIVTLFEIFIKFFSDNAIIAIRFLNILSIITFTYFLYKITNILFKNELANKIVLLLSVLFIPLIFFTTFVYGNLIGLALSTIGIYFILKWQEERKTKYCIISIISIGFAIIIKSNYKVYLIRFNSSFNNRIFKKI